MNQIPISRHRAIAHIQNPDADENDILLWAAYENEQLLGYVGVLPGYINTNQVREKIFWVSTFWVNENLRNGNLASMLFFPLIKQCGDKLLISNFLPSLEKMYQSLGVFRPTLYKFGSRFYLRSCFGDILPTRFPKIRFLKPLFRASDFVINSLLSIKKIFYKPIKFHSEIASDINFDEDFQDFINAFYKKNNFAERFSEHFEWILKYPWILQGKQDSESKRYYFSSKSEQFEYDSTAFFRSGKLNAFLLLKTKNRNLTVSYVFADDDMMDDVSAYILKKISDENLILLTIFDERIVNKIRKSGMRYIFERRCKRAYILPKTQNIAPDIFQEGDGDYVFT
ncbi:MAG: hypothetical protein LBE36_09605 [Flavobacteriaceae bacterium]|nr:hypothetical protein [Flavobacteriaceae bacterium]